MDEIRNPFKPGAGTEPPKLAGRDDIMHEIQVMLARVKAGKTDRGFVLTGLRGVGKTALLLECEKQAEKLGYQTVRIEMPERQQTVRLINMLYPRLSELLKQWDSAHEKVRQAFATLSGVVKRIERLELGPTGASVSLREQERVKSDVESDISLLFESVGKAARTQNCFLLIRIDEMQYMDKADLSALFMAMHNVTQLSLPIGFVGAGLPQILAASGQAKTYAERLMAYKNVGSLGKKDAFEALQQPAQAEGAEFSSEALQHIYKETQGYPYFLQLWGQEAWNQAAQSPITAQDAYAATEKSVRELDTGFFGVRFDKMTPSEKTYAYELAQLGPGPQRSGDIAHRLGKGSNQVAPIRDRLMRKGIAHSPEHGLIEFSAPLFDGFLKRVMGGAAETPSPRLL